MLKSVISWLATLGLMVSPAPMGEVVEEVRLYDNNVIPFVEVDRTEDNDMAVTLVYVDEDVYIRDVPQTDYNTRKSDGEDIDSTATLGYFRFESSWTRMDGVEETYYQFISWDDSVWWALTEEDLGFKPTLLEEYMLVYYDNDTTDCEECAVELECECELYDDIFLGCYKTK